MPEEFDPNWEYFAPDRDPEFWGEEDEQENVVFDLKYVEHEDRSFSIRRHPTYGMVVLSKGRREVDRQTKTFVEYECPICSKDYSCALGQQRYYCSKACSIVGRSELRLKAPREVRCEKCRKVFIRKTSTGYNTSKQRFCSLFCWNLCQKEGAAAPFKDGCPICGGPVIKSGKGRSAAKVFCSRTCKNAAQNRKWRRNHPYKKKEN